MGLMLVWLFVSIAIIIFCILKLKLNTAIALILGSLFMGLVSGLGGVTTITQIGNGFGNLMKGIGLSIGFGVILGQLTSDSGAARKIANTMVKATSKRYALYGLGLTAFILSIPVFYDVTFVILIPVAVAISKEIQKPLQYAVGTTVIGAATAHTLVPPTPNPLAAAEILHFDVGIMLLVGISVGILSALIAMKLYIWIMDGGFWNKEKDETGVAVYENIEEFNFDNAPSFIASIIPIILPVILILLGTVCNATMDTVPQSISFISNKVIAMLFGVLAAYVVSSVALSREEKDKSATEALKSCGIVLLITGAGGSFGAIIGATGMADMIASGISNISASPIVALIFAFFIAALLRIALGSGTVASITAMTIMSSVSATLGISPVWIAIACLSGSLSCGHVNDSGFWVSANLAGFTISGGLKTYTLGGALVGVLSMVFAMIGALIF
jgi:gluconate transporter